MKKIIIAGLGNPGPEYERTRHNMGFLVADKIREKAGFPEFQSWKRDLEFTSGEYAGWKVYLAKPRSYMNNSGVPLRKFSDFHEVKTEHVLVCFDDVSLEFGKIRIRKRGSSGGHNGMQSVIDNFSSREISRIRLGIGPKNAPPDLKDFVLSKFGRGESAGLEEFVSRGAEACFCLLETDAESAMNKYNL